MRTRDVEVVVGVVALFEREKARHEGTHAEERKSKNGDNEGVSEHGLGIIKLYRWKKRIKL